MIQRSPSQAYTWAEVQVSSTEQKVTARDLQTTASEKAGSRKEA